MLHTQNAGEGEVEVEDDDLTTAFYSDEQIDLGQLVLEQFYLAVPMKPLCRESCRGLCPECGTNLNTGTCSCTRESGRTPGWKACGRCSTRATARADAVAGRARVSTS